jgi:predicted phosphate transport protein (TIGR00153 family)
MSPPDHFRSALIDALPKSPYKQLMEHFKRVCKAARKMDRMIQLYMDGKFNEAAEVSVEVSKLEHEADEIKAHLRGSMTRMILTPISKDEFLEILRSNERIADGCQDVAQILDMRQTKIPEELHPMFKEFVSHIVDAVDSLRDMMDMLGEVFESTFARVDTTALIELGHHVHEHEYKADSINKQLSKKIYELEDRESPLAIFHLMKLADVLDSVADNAENAALRMVTAVSK